MHIHTHTTTARCTHTYVCKGLIYMHACGNYVYICIVYIHYTHVQTYIHSIHTSKRIYIHTCKHIYMLQVDTRSLLIDTRSLLIDTRSLLIYMLQVDLSIDLPVQIVYMYKLIHTSKCIYIL